MEIVNRRSPQVQRSKSVNDFHETIEELKTYPQKSSNSVMTLCTNTSFNTGLLILKINDKLRKLSHHIEKI